MDIDAEKAALRRALGEPPPPDWGPLTAAFLALPEVERAGLVLLFYGVGREPDTAPIIDELLRRGKAVALPKCLPGGRMEARRITSRAQLLPGAYGIPEPGEGCPAVPREEIELILVPHLCCDREGYRLGRGGGYYDRYLAGYGGVSAALCPEGLLREELPRGPFDVPVSLVLTERGIWRGGKPALRRAPH